MPNSGGTYGCILREVQNKTGDSQPKSSNVQKRQKGYTGNLPGLWDQSIPDRKGVGASAHSRYLNPGWDSSSE